jgi:hypothetical protein
MRWAVARDREKDIVAVRIEFGRLWIIRSASKHAFMWMICWTRKGAEEAMLAAQIRHRAGERA